jgi:excisionase family DNA binding protein
MPTLIEGIQFYTALEASRLLGVTPQTVRAYQKQGKLKGQKLGSMILFTEEALKPFIGELQDSPV